MDKKCKHQNGTLTEYMVATHAREVSNGTMDEIGYNDIGNITGYEYYCRDCKRRFRFTASVTIKQKWLKKIHDQLS